MDSWKHWTIRFPLKIYSEKHFQQWIEHTSRRMMMNISIKNWVLLSLQIWFFFFRPFATCFWSCIVYCKGYECAFFPLLWRFNRMMIDTVRNDTWIRRRNKVFHWKCHILEFYQRVNSLDRVTVNPLKV